MLTDEQLMEAIVDGDRQAYAGAVKQHGRAIAAYAFRMLGNESEAQDIAQETFLRLWTQAHRWDGDKASLGTWLHRIAHNLCIDQRRRTRADTGSELDEFTAEADTPSADQLAQQSDRNRLEAALADLPERQRSALVMTYYQGLSNKEVAGILDVSVDALESLLSRGRKALKNRLSKYVYQPDSTGGVNR
tara:strand:- start:60429 stop:60998 length:570 start_codon:yes stop_codon:yes gene_type:complete